MRKWIVLLMLLTLLIPVAGSVSAQDEPIRIGVVTDTSGALAIYGNEQTNGFLLGLLFAAGIDPLEFDSLEEALAEVSVADRAIEILQRNYGSENPASEPDDAAAATRELLEAEFADIIVGPPRSGAAVSVQNIASPDEFNVVFMSGPSATPAVTGENFNLNTFRVCRNALQDALTLAQILPEDASYIILAQDNAFGAGTAAGFDFAFPQVGVEPVADTIFAPSDTTDFTPFLQQAMDSGASHIVQIWAGASAVTLAQQTVELGVLDNMTLITGTNSNDIVAAFPLPPGIAYIVYNYTLPDTEVNDWLTERHIALFEDVPDLFTECGFASAQALYLALEATEGDPTPDAMIPALEGLSFEGPKGEYTIRESDHQALAPQYLIEFQGVEEVEIADGLTMELPQYELVAEISAEDAAPPCQLTGEFADRCE